MRLLIAGMAAALSVAGTAQAVDFITVNVSGTAMPWTYDVGSLNDSYQYGIQDGTGPAIVNFADLGINAGDNFGILFIGGLTSAFGGVPDVDNGGYRGSIFKNAELGSSGTRFPSFYLPGDYGVGPDEGVFLQSLVGAFADIDGAIVSPFSLGRVGGSGSTTLIGFSGGLGAGITRVQFGFNDDIFADNTGSLRVCVDRGDDSCSRFYFGGGAVPEPATWAMMITGFGLAGSVLRRRKALAA